MNFFKLRKLKKEIVPSILRGEVGVFPTDTIYGIVGCALDKKAVERIYQIKKRNAIKPLIILVSSRNDLKTFGIKINRKQKKFLKQVWPGKVSVVVDCENENFFYLHRGTRSLAFRVPKDRWLRNFLKSSGPLVAPSANPEGEKPARTKDEAKYYFGNQVDFYIDFGKLENEPSIIVKLFDNGEYQILR